MASSERTAYPRFGRLMSARELADLSPTEDDVAWARERSRSDLHLKRGSGRRARVDIL